MKKLGIIDKVNDHKCSTSCALNRIVNSIVDKIVEDLRDYSEKDEKVGIIAKRGNYEQISC